MNRRGVASNISVALIVSCIFSISLSGCHWTSNEIFAGFTFFVVAIVIGSTVYVLAPSWWAALIAVFLLPVIGAWAYGVLLLFAPGKLSVGPCVESSTWAAFPALYLTAGSTAALNRSLWRWRAIALTVCIIVLTSAVFLLRNVL